MTTLALAALIAMGSPAPATHDPVPAQTVIDTAVRRAKETDRNVYVIFHASWCGWCKRHDAFIKMPEHQYFYNKNFVVAHLTVMETEEEKAHENPGGIDLMKKWGGESAGLPFMAILNDKGELIVNSMRPEGEKKMNVGHPVQPEEAAWYSKMLEKSAKHAQPGDIKKIGDYLVKQKF